MQGQKHDFLFQGMLTCGYCGCAIVAELKKGKYVYYHCTGNKGKCPGKYGREEQIDQQFASFLDLLQLDDDVVTWIERVMNQETCDRESQSQVQLAALEQQRKRLEDRLERMYLDKLDGVMGEDEYRRLSNKFRSELTELKFGTERLKGEKQESILNGMPPYC